MDAFLDDGLNPRFVHFSPVFFDELDSQKHLPPNRLAAHIAAAVDTFHAGTGHAADELNIVRDLCIELLESVVSPANLRIDVWLDRIDHTTCVYGFLCSSENGSVPYARGERTVVRLDPDLRRPAEWSPQFVEKQNGLVKTLHAYA